MCEETEKIAASTGALGLTLHEVLNGRTVEVVAVDVWRCTTMINNPSIYQIGPISIILILPFNERAVFFSRCLLLVLLQFSLT